MGSDPIIVAIDAGNTRIKWGVHDGQRFVMTGAVMTSQAAGLADAWSDAPRAERAIASNVAGPPVRAVLEAACGRSGADKLPFLLCVPSKFGPILSETKLPEPSRRQT